MALDHVHVALPVCVPQRAVLSVGVEPTKSSRFERDAFTNLTTRAQCFRWDSNPHLPGLKSGDSASWSTKALGCVLGIEPRSRGTQPRVFAVLLYTPYSTRGEIRTLKHLILSQAALPICLLGRVFWFASSFPSCHWTHVRGDIHASWSMD